MNLYAHVPSASADAVEEPLDTHHDRQCEVTEVIAGQQIGDLRVHLPGAGDSA